MKKFLAISTALVVSLSASQAFAGGWGKSGYGVSSGLVNVSPNINLGGVNALNGIGAGGTSYLPTSGTHPDDTKLNYTPTVNPVASGGYSEFQVALIILAIAMGSVSLSHINDSGFWIATKFLGLSVGGGLKTWTLMCTIVGFLGIIIISIAWFITAALV